MPFFIIGCYLRNKESSFDFNGVINIVSRWSNQIKHDKLYDRFDRVPTVILPNFSIIVRTIKIQLNTITLINFLHYKNNANAACAQTVYAI